MATKAEKITKKLKTKRVEKSQQKIARIKTGIVVGNKAQKTLRVRVERKFSHPLYTKIVKRHKNYLVHSNEQVEVGKIIRFKEVKPISKAKKWVLIDVLEKKQI
ncbi:30S ribosomal protein S17 [Candidatus Dojkabacteria bacterium]|nr:30S ribosomal protein S17 [Candidatus Dojkabacteria bacterium]